MDTAMGHLVAQGQMAAMVVYVIQFMKNSDLPIFAWISEHTKNVNRLVSTVAAILVAGGITWTYDGEAGRLVLEGITQPNVMHALWAVASQLVMQQVGYDVVLKKPKAVVSISPPASVISRLEPNAVVVSSPSLGISPSSLGPSA